MTAPRPWAASDATDDERDVVRLFDTADNLVSEMSVTDACALGRELLDVASYVAGDEGIPHLEDSDGTCSDECVAMHPDHAYTRGEET